MTVTMASLTSLVSISNDLVVFATPFSSCSFLGLSKNFLDESDLKSMLELRNTLTRDLRRRADRRADKHGESVSNLSGRFDQEEKKRCFFGKKAISCRYYVEESV